MEEVKIRERILRLDTAAICDANKGLRVVDPAIKPVRSDLKMFGRAHVVACRDDFLPVIKALADASPGEILVINCCGGQRAVAGELFSTEAQRKGLAGIVVDGAIRDVKTIRKLEFPVYARWINPMSGFTQDVAEMRISVECGGIVIARGEYLFGDDEGIVVASIDQFAELIETAELIQKKESEALTCMAQGESLLSLLNFDEHYENRRLGKESKLTFS